MQSNVQSERAAGATQRARASASKESERDQNTRSLTGALLAVYNMSSSGADSVSSMDSANKNKNNNIRNINT